MERRNRVDNTSGGESGFKSWPGDLSRFDLIRGCPNFSAKAHNRYVGGWFADCKNRNPLNNCVIFVAYMYIIHKFGRGPRDTT